MIVERVSHLPNATGTLIGLRHGSLDPAVLYRAAIEGVSLNLAWGTDRMHRLGIAVESVRMVGGGARNSLWRRVLAEVLDAAVTALAEVETGGLGATFQAAHFQSYGVRDRTPLDVWTQRSGCPADVPTSPGRSLQAYALLGVRLRDAVRSMKGT